MLMLQHMNPILKLLSLLWRVLDISVQGFWVSSLFMGVSQAVRARGHRKAQTSVLAP